MASKTELLGCPTGPVERRRFTRYSLESQELSFDSGCGDRRGMVLNLCESGMSVYSEAPVEQGSVQHLRWELFQPARQPGSERAVMRFDNESGSFKVDFPDLSARTEHLEAEGVVVWVDKGEQRFGIKFQNLSKPVEHSIYLWALHHPLSTAGFLDSELDPPALLTDGTGRGGNGGAIIRAPFRASSGLTGQAPATALGMRRGGPWLSAVAILGLIGVVLWGIGAYWEDRAARAGSIGVAAAPLLRLAGSNTIGSALAPAMAQAFLKQLGAHDIHVVPGATAEEQSVQAVLPGFLPGTSSRVEIQIAAHGSATAFEGLMNAGCDIGMASRKIKPKEAGRLASLGGDWSSAASEHLLALDGIAVIVHPSNPLQELTKDQLAAIFSGTVTDWSEVSNQRGTIDIYAPGDYSGTYDIFKAVAMGGRSLSGSARRLEDSRALSDAVAADRNGIGFIGLPFILNAKALALSERGASSFQPNRLTVGTEDYMLSRRLYLYTPPNPENKYVRQFVDFALSAAGQEVVADAGFIAQNVTAEKDIISPAAPSEYRRLTKGAGRLSLDFRFLPGLTTLDSKAQSDLDRVVSFLADRGYSGNDLLLLGFTDNTGDPRVNVAVSQSRAKIVAEEFARRGLRPATVKGFGADLPVASNDNDTGRERNRRVEIWFKGAQCAVPQLAHDAVPTAIQTP